MYSYVKLTAEFKKIGFMIQKLTQLPVWRHQLGIWDNLGKLYKKAIKICLNTQVMSFLPHLYEKRHLDCIEIENKDRQWMQKAVMAVLGTFIEIWLVLKLYEGIVLQDWTLCRSKQKIHVLFKYLSSL